MGDRMGVVLWVCCVKPPVIYGDVSRLKLMTVFWSKMSQSITPRPMKGMLTGVVTILNRSFVRNDQPRCYEEGIEQAEEQIMHKRQEATHVAQTLSSKEVDRQDLLVPNSISDINGILATHVSSGVADTRSQPFPGRYKRDDDFDLDLEDIIVMEAI